MSRPLAAVMKIASAPIVGPPLHVLARRCWTFQWPCTLRGWDSGMNRWPLPHGNCRTNPWSLCKNATANVGYAKLAAPWHCQMAYDLDLCSVVASTTPMSVKVSIRIRGMQPPMTTSKMAPNTPLKPNQSHEVVLDRKYGLSNLNILTSGSFSPLAPCRNSHGAFGEFPTPTPCFLRRLPAFAPPWWP